LPYFLSIQIHCTPRRPAQATDQAQQKTLDFSSGIQNRYELTLLDLQAEPLQDFYRTLVARNRLAQVEDLQDGLGLLTELFFPDDI
jgi:hypothetical protein